MSGENYQNISPSGLKVSRIVCYT